MARVSRGGSSGGGAEMLYVCTVPGVQAVQAVQAAAGAKLFWLPSKVVRSHCNILASQELLLDCRCVSHSGCTTPASGTNTHAHTTALCDPAPGYPSFFCTSRDALIRLVLRTHAQPQATDLYRRIHRWADPADTSAAKPIPSKSSVAMDCRGISDSHSGVGDGRSPV